ncbi:hypothetical protein KKD62_00185 [Patescibacteria group bacterium]|nr:hypothetical protein [Patescibacteria group bacterium]MBU1931176.1 hypothetical protein [Patescibacteria group bacterium]
MSPGSPDKLWSQLQASGLPRPISGTGMDALLDEIALERRPEHKEKPPRLLEILTHVWSGDGGLAQQAVVVSLLGQALRDGVESFPYGEYSNALEYLMLIGGASNLLICTLALEADQILPEEWERTNLLSPDDKSLLSKKRYDLDKQWAKLLIKGGHSLQKKVSQRRRFEREAGGYERVFSETELELLFNFHLSKLETMYWFVSRLLDYNRSLFPNPQMLMNYLPKEYRGSPELKAWWNRNVGEYLPYLQVKDDQEIPNLGQIMSTARKTIKRYEKLRDFPNPLQ